MIHFFFTNNVCESTNRILNMKAIGMYKTFYSFKRAILDLLNYFKNKNVYKEKYISLTRAMGYYAKNTKKYKLITDSDIENIINDYLKFRKKINFH